MIDVFESTVQYRAKQAFFTYVDENGTALPYTYRRTRMMAAALARWLRERGVRPGDAVAVDLPNCPAFVFLALAAGYGEFTLVTLNNRLSRSEKAMRFAELEHSGIRVVFCVDEDNVAGVLDEVRHSLGSKETYGVRLDDSLGGSLEDVVHFAEHAATVFDPDRLALIMFTSGTTGKPKAALLSWRNLMGSAQSSDVALRLPGQGKGLWQATLPFFHVGGFQVLVRSVMSKWPLVIYARFSAAQLLADAPVYHATHVSVVDKMLQDLLDEAEANPAAAQALGRYRYLLLGGGPLNARTLARSLAAKLPVYASYGMTETSSQIANALVNEQFDGGLNLLLGYSARIVDPDPDGYGRLAVSGPGVFEGYANAQTAYTADGYFLTGDTACMQNNRLYLRERTQDMFISGGENVYPAEIADAIVRTPGVADAYVFGIPDKTWGRRPVALVERASRAKEPFVSAAAIKQSLKTRLSRINQPDYVCVVDELPRSGIGKIDRAACERAFDQRIQIDKVVLHYVRLPFKNPFRTSKGMLVHRDLIIVEVTDHLGRTGLGECTSFPTNWYLPEILGEDAALLQTAIVPHLRSSVYLHPREVSVDLEQCGWAAKYPAACSAVETACWDLYGKIAERPLWEELAREFDYLTEQASGQGHELPSAVAHAHMARRNSSFERHVFTGAVVGMGSVRQTMEDVHACVRAGYQRVKLKVAPGKQSLAAVQAIRKAYPHLLITLDANQSFTLDHLDELRAYDRLNVGWIEEPFDLASIGSHEKTGAQALNKLAVVQHMLDVPICVDESFANAQEAQSLFQYQELRCAMVKVSKFGGIRPALAFVHQAVSSGREVCMSGMYDTGISRFAHAAFQTLPGVVIPGDLGATSRYFEQHLTRPLYETPKGAVTLNSSAHPYGIGCELDYAAVDSVLVHRMVIG